LYLHRGWAYFFCEAWTLAIQDFDEAIRRRPEDGEAYAGRGYAWVKLDHYRTGVQDAREGLRHGSTTPEVLWFNVACLFAQAAGRVRGDPREPERRSLEQEYRQQTIANLRRVLDLCSSAEERWLYWRDRMVLDPALDPVRETPEFLALKEELAKAASLPPR
jgi:hypothetical protein